MNLSNCQDTKLIHKSVAFLHINNEKSGKQITKTIPFTIVIERIKYLGIKLTKAMKDLYTENYKMLLNEITEDTNKQKESPCP